MSSPFDIAFDQYDDPDDFYDSEYEKYLKNGNFPDGGQECGELQEMGECCDDGLTPEQREVVNVSEGRHLVLAPPGTGKTHILTQRVIQALKNGVPKDKMFCGTFTIRAATEMRERVIKESKLKPKQLPEIGNIHHFCHHFLTTRQLVPQTRQIVDEEFVREMVEDCISDFVRYYMSRLRTDGLADDSIKNFVKHYKSFLQTDELFDGSIKYLEDNTIGVSLGILNDREMSAIKGFFFFKRDCIRRKQPLSVAVFTKMMGLRERKAGMPERLCDSEIKEECLRDFVEEILERYERIKESLFVLDFDDLLIETYVHLAAGELDEKDKYKWVQVDEVQDLNPLQWEIVESIATKDAVMVFFGDYEQSIFSFMGASLGVLDQKADTCTMHFFKKNFRATSYLLDLLTRYSFKVLDSRFAFIPFPNAYEIGTGCLVRDQYRFDVPYYITGWSYHRTDYIGARKNKAEAMGEYAVSFCRNFVTMAACGDDEPKRIAVLVQRNADADQIANLLEKMYVPGVVRFSGVEYSQLAVFRNANALFEVTSNPFSRPGWSRLFSLFGGKTHVPNRAVARRFAAEMFDLCINPYDLFEGDGVSLPQKIPLVRYAQYAKTGRIVVFDTETTGLDTQHDEIIQLSAAEYVCGRLGKSLDLYLKCGRPIPPEAEAVHHISQKILDERGIDPTEGIKRFLDFVGDKSLLVAHNLEFDRAMLINGCRLHGIPFNPDDIEMCDSLTLVRRLYPKFTKYKLGYLREKLGLEGNNSHNAMDDVWAAGSLMLHLAEEGARYVDRQQGWLQEHAGFVKHFRDTFKGYFDAFRRRSEGVCSIRDEVVRLRDFVDTVNSAQETTSLDRLEHFFQWADEKYKGDTRTFSTVLSDDWLDLSRMKEADLLTRSDRVIVSTVHKAKGLQFDTVIVPDADDYPSYSARQHDEAGVEESKRLLYVAMSRAKWRLILASGVGIDMDTGRVHSEFTGHAAFLEGVSECFNHGFRDFFYQVERNHIRPEKLENSDWLARQYRLTKAVQEQFCPADAGALMGDGVISIRRMATKTLEWMKDESERRTLIRSALGADRGRLIDAAVPLIGRIRDVELIRDLRRMMAKLPLPFKRYRVLIFGVYEEMRDERAVRDALEDCLYFCEGWARKEAARILSTVGDASWVGVVDGSCNDWDRLAELRAEKHDSIIKWMVENKLPVSCKGLRSVAEARGIELDETRKDVPHGF